MKIDDEKYELMEAKIEELLEKTENDELSQWESILLNTLLWIIEDEDTPTFFF